MSNPTWSIRSFSPLPDKKALDICAFNPFVTATTVSKARPGGFMGGTIGLAELPTSGVQGRARGWPYLPQPVFAVPLGHIEVYCGTRIVNEGRLIEGDFIGSVAGGMRIEGYALQAANDTPWDSPGLLAADPAFYPAGRLLLQALAETCPFLPPAQSINFIDNGTLHRHSELTGKTAAQLAQQFGTEGDGTSLYDFMVGMGRQVSYLPRLAPPIVQYREDVDGGVTIQETGTDLAGTVYVRYTDAFTGASNQLVGPFTDPTFSARFGGLSRTKEIQGGTMSAAGATAYGRTWLAKFSQPVFRVSIKRDAWRGVRHAPGGMRSPWFVEPTEWVKVGNLPALPIIRLDCDVSSGVTTIQLGDPPMSGSEMQRSLIAGLRAAKLGVNINTWAHQ